MTHAHLNCTRCPNCGSRTKVVNTAPDESLHFASTKRQRQCPNCAKNITTFEIPAALARDIYPEDVPTPAELEQAG